MRGIPLSLLYCTNMLSRMTIGIIVLIVLLGLILLVARAFGIAYKISPMAMRGTMLGALLVPLFFILSILGGRTGGIPPIVYTIINIIAGIAYYIFLSGIVLLILQLFAKLLHASVSPAFATLLLIAAITASVIGLFQARTIVVRDYTVAIPNLPAALDGKQAVLVSDTHFGLINHKKFSDKIVTEILSLHPEFVLHAGDFYDGPKTDTEPLTQSWQKLTAQIPVFYAPGNHETYGDYNAFIESIKKANVTVLDNKVTDYKGIQIAGITYSEGRASADAKTHIENLQMNTTEPAILINHPPTSLEAASAKGFSLMVSGHTHNGQFWPNEYLVRKIYGDYAYGLNKFKDMDVLTSAGVGTFGPPMRLFNPAELVVITLKKQ